MAAVTVIVLIHCQHGMVAEAAEALVNLPEVSEVYSVSGEVDLIALVRFQAFDEIADIIATRISKTPGVARTSTHVAFRQYSQSDLDESFGLD